MDALRIDTAPRRLGTSSLEVAPLAYGCWRFAGTDVAAARAKIDTALETGMTLFDHADIYGGDGAAEALFGDVLRDAPVLRESMVIATKCGIVRGVPYDSGAAHIRAACDASLRRLNIDVIDLYQIHRPDMLGHPAEVAAAMHELREAGKIREVGVSNYTTAQFDALQAHLPFPIVTHQPEFSAWRLDPLRDGVLDQCMERTVTPLAWSSLAGGTLGMTYEDTRAHAEGERLAALLARLDALAEREGVSRAAVALAFLLVHPAGIIPIVGSQRIERIADSANAYRVSLTKADWYVIVEASQGERLP